MAAKDKMETKGGLTPEIDSTAIIAAMRYTGQNAVRNGKREYVSRTAIIKWLEAHRADIDHWPNSEV